MEMLKQMFGEMEVRAFEQDGQAWVVASDATKALGISNTSLALSRLDEDEKGICSTDTLGGVQEVLTVSESGLYSLIFTSRRAEAKLFKRWVTHDLLPTLRRAGFCGQSGVAA